MVLVIISCLFVFLGMYIGKKNDLKKSSINMLFGLFFINSLCVLLKNGFSILSLNYHSSTYYFVTLGSILGFVLMKIIDMKCEETDDISICGFVVCKLYKCVYWYDFRNSFLFFTYLVNWICIYYFIWIYNLFYIFCLYNDF